MTRPPPLPQDCMRAASPPCMALLTELAVDTLDLSDNKRLDDGSMQVGRAVLLDGVWYKAHLKMIG